MIKLSITVRYSMKTLAYTILKVHHDPPTLYKMFIMLCG